MFHFRSFAAIGLGVMFCQRYVLWCHCLDTELSLPISAMLTAVEEKRWKLGISSGDNTCLIGKTDCKIPLKPPLEKNSFPPEVLPVSKNAEYQKLALTAETIVPKTWWRAAFMSPELLLYKSPADGPKVFYDPKKSLAHKRLRNLYQCSTRQDFIRKPFPFAPAPAEGGKKPKPNKNGMDCASKAKTNRAVQELHNMWMSDVSSMSHLNASHHSVWGGNIKRKKGKPVTDNKPSSSTGGFFSFFTGSTGGTLSKVKPVKGTMVWIPHDKQTPMRTLAQKVLNYFYDTAGGVWTGCFAVDEETDSSAYCRGALGTAALIESSHILAELTMPVAGGDSAGDGHTSVHTGSTLEIGEQLVKGYMLAALGRALIHADMSVIAGRGTTSTAWKLNMHDFVVLQGLYMSIYTASLGEMYTNQLEKYVPVSFPPSDLNFAKIIDNDWRPYSTQLEPVYSTVRNWMYTEASTLIDFGCYIPLVSFREVRVMLNERKQKRVLVDVGANGFLASPKYLLDSYASYMPFTDAIMIEPEPHFSATIPEAYKAAYNIEFLQIYAEVATQSKTDMIELLPTLVTKEDFVVLKFDVDPNRYAQGPTMEWGFLYSLLRNPNVAQLVDELYIELHFQFPTLQWDHYHSQWEALDCIRALRAQGMVIHSWP